MTYSANDDSSYQPDPPIPVHRARRGILFPVIVFLLLAGLGSGAAYVWWASDGHLPAFSSLGTETPGESGDQAALKDLQDLGQRTSESVQSAQQTIAAQQAAISRLSEQVAALSNKLEAIERSVTAAQAPPPTVATVRPPPAPAAARKPAAPKPASKPAGAISVGGAPLPTNEPSSR